MATQAAAKTMFEKIWARNAVTARPGGQTLIYVDCHPIHDGYAPAFELLAARGLSPRAPSRAYATLDRYVPTDGTGIQVIADPERRQMIETVRRAARRAVIPIFDFGDSHRGIVHVVGPEQGITQPGMVVVCADSHTSTHGGLGALAFGVGMTEASHVLATQTIWQTKPKTMRITVDGELGAGVSSKDIILALIGRIGATGAAGHVVEYAGSAIRRLTIEGRLTVCSMSNDAGARAGMIAPDDTTYAYLAARPRALAGARFDAAVRRWRRVPSDPGAQFDREMTLDAGAIAPMVTWGTSPEDVVAIDGRVPDPAKAPDAERRESITRALAYMDLKPGMKLSDIWIDRVFIGSCANGRIEDLRAAAAVVKGRRVALRARAWVVPGSIPVKRQAEAEGLAIIFKNAGFEWREPGCSMCLGGNGEVVGPGQRCVSTSTRNFVGSQGQGARTHLMSPVMAAAAAVSGRLADVRPLLAQA